MNAVGSQKEETVIKFNSRKNYYVATSDGAEIEVFLSLPIR